MCLLVLLKMFRYVLLVLMISTCHTRRYSRLTWPSENGARMQIVPHMEVPMTMAPSVQSGMKFRLPITMKFAGMGGPAMTIADAVTLTDGKKKQREDEVIFDGNESFLNDTRAKSRALFYKSIETSNSKWGESCLLRAICEVAEIPAINSGTGILGELLDLFLT